MTGFVEWKEPPVWLSVAQTAVQLGITDRTVHRLINEGALVGYKIGRSYRILSGDIGKYLDSVRCKPGDLEHLIPKRYDAPRHIDLRAVEAS